MSASTLIATRQTGVEHWVARLQSLVRAFDLTPVHVTLIYLAFGFAALYVSDVLFVQLLAEPLLSQVQALKGGVEVLLTGGLIYVLTSVSRASLQRKNEELEAARRELGVLHRVLRHNLRNTLTVIAGYADQLATETTTDTLEAYCDTIKTTCEEFTDSVEKVKHLSDLHATGFRTTTLDCSVMLDRLQAESTRRYPGATIDLDRPAAPDVKAHHHVEFALRELVDNAVVHNPSPAPTVAITAERPPSNPKRMRIRVEDDGPGIPQEELEALRQQEETPLVHGSGVGLWVARWIVLQSNGSFEIDNTPTGCQVTMLLPTPRDSPLDVADADLAAIFE